MTLFYIILANLLVGIISFVGILILYKKRSNNFIKIIISLAAGALLGAVFISILPELFSHHEHHKELTTKTLSLIILVSILSFFLIEKYFHWHHCQCDQAHHEHTKKPVGYINLIGDGLHNFIDGTLIASSFLISPSLGVVTTVVIIMHEIPQEISDFGILIYSGFSKVKALWWNFVSALTAVLGGILAYIFSTSIEKVIPILLSIAAGSFLYLAMSDIIPELHHEKNKKQIAKQFIWLIIGLLIIYLVSNFSGHSH